MNLFSISYRNFRSNLKTYGLYLSAMIFSVTVYYNFVSLKYNPSVLQLQETSSTIAAAANATAVVLLIFLVFFIWFSSSFFLNQRKKEIGIYTFMGIEKHKIALIFTIESFFLGITSIIVGLSLGVLLSRLFIMILAKVALLNMKISFFVSLRGLLETTKVFLIIFTITSLKGYIDITRSKLIDLFNALRKEEKMPTPSYLKGFLSIIIIGIGYYVSDLSLRTSFDIAALVTIFLVIWGTYWLFGSFFTIVAKYLTKKKNILYKGTNLISISNLTFKIRKNYRTLAAIAVLTATTITAFGTVSSMKYFVNQNYKIEIPYSFSYVSHDNALKDNIKKTIDKSKHNLLLWENISYLNIDEFNTNYTFYHDSIALIKYSDFQRVTKNLKVKGYEKLIREMKLDSGEAIYVEKPGVIMSISEGRNVDNYTVNIYNTDFNIKNKIKTPLLGSAVAKPVIVVQDSEYELLRASFLEETLNGFIISNEEDSTDLGYTIATQLPGDTKLFSFHGTTYYIYGILYFLGSFMSLVFVMATGSIIYFKLLSDALDDKEKYQILKKIGMTQDEIIQSVSKQVGISFAAPLIVGSIHSIVAIRVLSKLMNYNLVVPTLISILIFTAIYGIFYYTTTRRFVQIVCEN